MPQLSVVGFSGNIHRPSKTKGLVGHITEGVVKATGGSAATYDVVDLGESFLGARRLSELDPGTVNIVEQILSASVLVVGSPTYKGSYTGLFKHFFDLFDPSSLRGKPVVLAATGGGERHSLIVEHQFRPLFGFFEAMTMPTAIYASEQDFADGVLISEPIRARAAQAALEARRFLGLGGAVNLAA